MWERPSPLRPSLLEGSRFSRQSSRGSVGFDGRYVLHEARASGARDEPRRLVELRVPQDWQLVQTHVLEQGILRREARGQLAQPLAGAGSLLCFGGAGAGR